MDLSRQDFVRFNSGAWTGRALHISAQDGEYIKPFVRDFELNVIDDGDKGVSERMVEVPGQSKVQAMMNESKQQDWQMIFFLHPFSVRAYKAR